MRAKPRTRISWQIDMLIYCEFADAKGFLDTTRMREISQEEQLWYFTLHPSWSLNAVLCYALTLSGALYALHLLINVAWLRYQ
ncbi:hypothetical protein T01_11137 [Trichinella spiralis]|uniref:Uncharacterized protein n=2 Tax=Trichinella spiralis TaxID=6334 RepID=A0A0V1BF50_TRISP|nr:hypothetical protein T01_11137 [Trichinella spiralis]